MDMDTWRSAAWRAVAELDRECPADMPRADYCRKLRDAYPFGPREYWPYKVWLEVQRAAIERRFPGTTTKLARRKPKRTPGQMEFE